MYWPTRFSVDELLKVADDDEALQSGEHRRLSPPAIATGGTELDWIG